VGEAGDDLSISHVGAGADGFVVAETIEEPKQKK